MKKVFVMPPHVTINGEQLTTIGHISALDTLNLREKMSLAYPHEFIDGVMKTRDAFHINPASLAIEIEAAVELPSPREDIWKTLIDDDRMNIVIKDERGRELHIPNAQIIQRVRITGRIPRKMKKHLKRIHGVDWKQYHPNAENEVNINSK